MASGFVKEGKKMAEKRFKERECPERKKKKKRCKKDKEKNLSCRALLARSRPVLRQNLSPQKQKTKKKKQSYFLNTSLLLIHMTH